MQRELLLDEDEVEANVTTSSALEMFHRRDEGKKSAEQSPRRVSISTSGAERSDEIVHENSPTSSVTRRNSNAVRTSIDLSVNASNSSTSRTAHLSSNERRRHEEVEEESSGSEDESLMLTPKPSLKEKRDREEWDDYVGVPLIVRTFRVSSATGCAIYSTAMRFKWVIDC